MKQLARKLHVAIVSCFLIVCFSTITLAKKPSNQPDNTPENKAFNHAVSQLLARSNSAENLPDITNEKLRDKVLRKAAREFLGSQRETVESDVYFFSDTDAEGPWFRGWYTRLTGEDGSSIAVVGATQYLPGTSMSEDTPLPGYLAVIVNDLEQTRIYETFPEETAFWTNRDLIFDDPNASVWEDFLWCVAEDGQCTDNIITNKYVKVALPEINLSATIGSRLPYNATIQWLGPEGMVEFLPFVPLHWFVYTLGSETTYEYEILDGGNVTVNGSGYAHQESNWGTTFPPAWVWSEGINQANTHQFALSGGELAFNGSSLTTWLVAYHSPRIQWQFRPTLPETEYITTVDSCPVNDIFSFSITAKDSIRKLVISAQASRDSFVEVSVPTEDGFLPGADESFSANVLVKAYIRLRWFGYILIDRAEFKNVALEFGADYRYVCR